MVSTEEAARLKSRYRKKYDEQQRGRPDLMVIILSVVGALVLGLGVLLFFSYNWDEMPRALRMGIIIAGMVGAYVSGYLVREGKRTYRYLGEGLIFLGVALFGAGIWLIPQMYNVNAHEPNGWLFWALGALTVAFAARSIPAHVAASVLLMIWTSVEALEFRHLQLHWYVVAVVFGILPFAYWTRSLTALLVALACVTLGFLQTTAGISGFMALHVSSALGCVLLLAGIAHSSRRYAGFTPLYTSFGLLILIPVAFEGSFRRLQTDFLAKPGNVGWTVLGVLCGLGLLGLGLIVTNWRNRNVLELAASPRDGRLMLLLSIFGLVLATVPPLLVVPLGMKLAGFWLAILWNLGLLALAFLMLNAGQRQDRLSLLYLGTVILLLLVTGRYFDLSESMLQRSIYFLVAGAFLVCYAIWLARKHRSIRSCREGEI